MPPRRRRNTPASTPANPPATRQRAQLPPAPSPPPTPTETFHTPSFGDDLDFQPLALQQPTHVDLESGRVFAASASTAPRLSHAPSGGVPYPGGQTQPLSHLPTNTDGFNNGLNHHNPYPNHSLPNHLQHQHAQHPQHPQQQQQQHCLPKFPPQTFDIPDIQVTNSVIGVTNTHGGLNTIVTATAHVTTTNPQFYHHPPQHAHLGQVRGQAVGMANQLSPGSTHNSPGRESVDENSSDDSLPLAQIAVTTTTRKGRGGKAAAPKKAKTPKRRKKKDPNEPQKPVSAYALFFRDTQAAIKSQNPSASFGEVSKIVASMWDQLDDENKGAYKKRTELAKKEYLKQLAAYRASLVSSGGLDGVDPIGDGVPHASPSPHQPSPPRPQPAQHPIPSSMPPPVVMTTMSQPMVSLSHGNGGMGGGGGGMPLLAATPQQQQQQQQPMMRGGGPLSQGMQMPPPTGPHGNMAGRMAPPMGGMENPALGSLSQQQQQQHHNMMAGSPPMAGQQHTMDYFNSNQVHGGGPGTTKLNSPGHGQMCVRHGCTNPAIVNQGWDNEYCSNECVVSHCRDVFSQWVAARQGSNSYASVK